MNSANKLITSGAGSYHRRGHFFFLKTEEDCTSKPGLVGCSEPSVIDSYQGCGRNAVDESQVEKDEKGGGLE